MIPSWHSDSSLWLFKLLICVAKNIREATASGKTHTPAHTQRCALCCMVHEPECKMHDSVVYSAWWLTIPTWVDLVDCFIIYDVVTWVILVTKLTNSALRDASHLPCAKGTRQKPVYTRQSSKVFAVCNARQTAHSIQRPATSNFAVS